MPVYQAPAPDVGYAGGYAGHPGAPAGYVPPPPAGFPVAQYQMPVGAPGQAPPAPPPIRMGFQG